MPSSMSSPGPSISTRLAKNPSVRSLFTSMVDENAPPERRRSNLSSASPSLSESKSFSSPSLGSDESLSCHSHLMVPTFVSIPENPRGFSISEDGDFDGWGYYVNGDTTDKPLTAKRPNRIFAELQKNNQNALRKDWPTVPI
ncbi:hypothetical protein IV203_034060 [Nitzschia inconspicua]|uniref:Uncharacterized protein n=1 Tax=Nitzschia inconspicua TaxID=303405 RepID=A0A9K3M736_9STRA|nr:hypothetical protein IV203_034060 [Nitzschia inconspicua]